jgi:NAD(P)-dependent dehydrogenase (short-subunit alcohol dehydrogenase family)
MPLSRRALLTGTGVLAAGAALPACSRPEVQRPAGVPLSPFTGKSTAEEVTAGLDLSGRLMLVTGANSGLGYETLRVLALRGATVIATARSLDKAQAACASAGAGRAIPLALELTDFDSVVAAANAVAALGKPLDAIVANAGIMELPQLEQAYGLEKHFVTNHLGHFILVNRLLPQLAAAPQGRVVVVSSGQSFNNAPAGGIQFDNLSGERDYDPKTAYGQSKLANVLFTRQLARRLAGTRVTANSLQPGVIMTNLGRHLPWYTLLTARLFGWAFMKPVEAGAATQVYLAAHPLVASVSGLFFRDCNPVIVPDSYLQDDAQAERLWQVSTELTARWLA